MTFTETIFLVSFGIFILYCLMTVTLMLISNFSDKMEQWMMRQEGIFEPGNMMISILGIGGFTFICYIAYMISET